MKHPISFRRLLKVLLLTTVLSSILFTSCKKNVEPSLPDERESAAINFYLTSEVMNAAYGPSRGITAAYVDNIINKGEITNNTDSRYPVFAFGFFANPEFPQVAELSGINLPTYIRYAAGAHKLYFTDVTNTIVADTNQVLKAGTWNTLYLADKPQPDGTEAAYTVLAVDEPREVHDGKTGVRFVHVSPDAGPLECRALNKDGSPVPQALATVRFREASAYTWLTQEQAANGLLRLQIGNSQIDLTTGIPAKPGRSFVVLIRGFLNNSTRQVTTGKNSDGSLHKETVTINANLRTEIRTTY